MKCPSEIELNEYAEDRLATGRRWEVEQHLHECLGCRTDLEGLEWSTGALAALVDDELDDDVHPEPEDLAALKEGNLPALRRAEVLTHMGACPECAHIYGSLPQEKRELRLMRSWQPLAAAASLLVVVGLVFLFARAEFSLPQAPAPAIERQVQPAAPPPAASKATAPAPGAPAPSAPSAASGGAGLRAGNVGGPHAEVQRPVSSGARVSSAGGPRAPAATSTKHHGRRQKSHGGMHPSGLGGVRPSPPPAAPRYHGRGRVHEAPAPPPPPKIGPRGPVVVKALTLPPTGGSGQREGTAPAREFSAMDAARGGSAPNAKGASRTAEASAPNAVKSTDGLAVAAKPEPAPPMPSATMPGAPGMPGAPAVAPAPAPGGVAALAVPGPGAPARPLVLTNRLLRDREWLAQLRNDPQRKTRVKALLKQLLKEGKSGLRPELLRRALLALDPVAPVRVRAHAHATVTRNSHHPVTSKTRPHPVRPRSASHR